MKRSVTAIESTRLATSSRNFRSFDPGFEIPDYTRADSETLHIYSDLAGLGNHRPSFLILPWVQDASVDELLNSYIKSHRFVKWSNLIEMADVAVLPFDASCLISQRIGEIDNRALEYARSFISNAQHTGTPTMAIVSGDSTRPLSLDFDIVLRHSIDRSRSRKGEFCLPGWFGVAQNSDAGATINPSPRRERPILSFCGQAATRDRVSSARRLRHQVKGLLPGCGVGSDNTDALLLRRNVLDHFLESHVIETSFIDRTRYFGCLSNQNQAREEYLQNMDQSDYVLCVRGMGNYSFRFYDALANGRVPVVIDTHCALPFDHIIEYDRLIPVIPLKNLRQAEDVILQHYESFNDDEWRQMLSGLRKFYLDLMSPIGFFERLYLIPELLQRIQRPERRIEI